MGGSSHSLVDPSNVLLLWLLSDECVGGTVRGLTVYSEIRRVFFICKHVI